MEKIRELFTGFGTQYKEMKWQHTLKLLHVLAESGLSCWICSAGKANMTVSHSSELGPNS